MADRRSGIQSSCGDWIWRRTALSLSPSCPPSAPTSFHPRSSRSGLFPRFNPMDRRAAGRLSVQRENAREQVREIDRSPNFSTRFLDDFSQRFLTAAEHHRQAGTATPIMIPDVASANFNRKFEREHPELCQIVTVLYFNLFPPPLSTSNSTELHGSLHRFLLNPVCARPIIFYKSMYRRPTSHDPYQRRAHLTESRRRRVSWRVRSFAVFMPNRYSHEGEWSRMLVKFAGVKTYSGVVVCSIGHLIYAPRVVFI